MSGKPKQSRRSAPEVASPTKPPIGEPFAGPKLWVFRIGAVVLVPMLLLAAVAAISWSGLTGASLVTSQPQLAQAVVPMQPPITLAQITKNTSVSIGLTGPTA